MPPTRSLLYLAREYPFPLNAAARLRTFNWLLHLSQRFDVTFVAPVCRELSDMEREALDGRCQRVVAVRVADVSQPWRWPQRLWHALRHVFTGIPTDGQILSCDRITSAVQELTQARRFDVVFAESWTQAQLASTSAQLLMLDAGSLQTPRQIEAWRHRHRFLHRLSSLWAPMQQQAEVDALHRFHLILLDGAQARQDLMRVATEIHATLVLPDGLNTEHFTPSETGYHPRRIVFHSSLRSFNQQDALYHLRAHVLPRVRERFGDVLLTVLSPSCPKPLREEMLDDPGVEYIGTDVEDPRPLLQQAVLAVLPLRLGRGSRSRLMQLLAMGVPVVATPLATAGLDLASGDGLLIAREGDAFADAMVQVLQDTSLRRDLSWRGRSLAEARLSLHATYGHLTDILSEARLDVHTLGS